MQGLQGKPLPDRLQRVARILDVLIAANAQRR
jgi:hypothetical protein